MSTDAKVDEIQAIVSAIKEHLAGHAREVQGAVLADLLAMWLSGPSESGT